MASLSNIPQDVPISVKAGATFSFPAVFSISLTGQTVRLRVASQYGSDLLLQLDNGASGGIVLSTTTLANDTATVTFTDEQLGVEEAGIPVGEHVYDFEREAGGIVFPIMSGKFTVEGQV